MLVPEIYHSILDEGLPALVVHLNWLAEPDKITIGFLSYGITVKSTFVIGTENNKDLLLLTKLM